MNDTFFSLYEGILELINGAIIVVISLAVAGFMWGIVKMLFSSDNAIAQKEAKSFMMYGIFTIFVMTSVWGLVNLLSGAITPVLIQDDPSTNNYNDEFISPEDPSTNNYFDNFVSPENPSKPEDPSTNNYFDKFISPEE